MGVNAAGRRIYFTFTSCVSNVVLEAPTNIKPIRDVHISIMILDLGRYI